MQITNSSSAIVTISDMPGGQSGQGLTIQPGASITVYDQDADRSAQLASLLTSGALTKSGSLEPSSGSASGDQSAVIVGSGAAQVTVTGAAGAGKALVASSATAAAWVTAAGPAGATGPAGPTGPAGAAGAAGADGALSVHVFTSAAGAGGAATEAMVLTGLLATDTILAVSQSAHGANGLALLGFNTLANNALTAVWASDPGAGSVIVVTVKR